MMGYNTEKKERQAQSLPLFLFYNKSLIINHMQPLRGRFPTISLKSCKCVASP
jgi:hypothetical protein